MSASLSLMPRSRCSLLEAADGAKHLVRDVVAGGETKMFVNREDCFGYLGRQCSAKVVVRLEDLWAP